MRPCAVPAWVCCCASRVPTCCLRAARARKRLRPGSPTGSAAQAEATPAEAERGPGGRPWFEPAPLLPGVRPELRATPALAAPQSSALPLYELEVQVDGTRFDVRETLWFTQREPAPLPRL